MVSLFVVIIESMKRRSNAASSSESTQMSKKSRKEIGKEIGGNPDEWDQKNLQRLIDTYEKAFPGRLKRMKEDERVEAALSNRTKDFGVISKESDLRVAFWMPEDLQEVIERGYPSLWTNKKHIAWFLKRFPLFKRSEKF